jgi:16S rRNA C967 or C1407 C5-methylase (RsmB/RsmF family)
MIKEFEIALEVLTDVLDQKTPFAEALRSKFQKNLDLRPLRGLVAGLVGCELRHQLYFDFMLKGLETYEVEEKRLLALALANAFFFRRFDTNLVHESLKERFGEEKLALAQPLFDLTETPENYIPDTVDRRGAQYLSLRFNVPEWMVKILNHFGGAAAYQSLRKFSRPFATTLRVRTSALGMKKVLENPDFTEAAVPGMVIYKGTTPLRKIPEFRKGQLFPEKLLTKHILDAHPVAEPSEVLLYNGNADPSLELELIETYGANVGMNIAVPDVDKKVEVTKLIKEKNLHNVNFFSAPDPESMEASVSGMQKLVVVAPNSTNFDLIPTSPDYMLHFDRNSMDSLIEGEHKALEGAAKYVDEGGTLLYIVYTISKKEGHARISDFLKTHREFKLVSEEQHFPYDEFETAAYVCELRKGAEELTIPPAFADLATSATSAASIPQASAK